MFDDEFQTVSSTDDSQIDFDHDDWYQTFGLHPSQYVPDDVHDEPVPAHHAAESEGATQLEEHRFVRDQLVKPPRSTLQRECDPDPTPLPVSTPAPPSHFASSHPVPPLQAASPPIESEPALQRETTTEQQVRESSPLVSPSPVPAPAVPQQEVATPEVKRRPGRPRKNPIVPTQEVVEQPARRGPGRPRKQDAATPEVRRGSGRPRVV